MLSLGKTLKGRFDFKWDVLDVIIGGKSTLDSLTGFRIHSLEEAERFIRSYGFELDNPIEKAELQGNFHEALSFIRRFFLQPDNPEGLKIEIPRKILELTDLRELFLMASLRLPGQSDDSYGQTLKHWSCSILKVMHTIAHIDKDPRSSYFGDVQKQIFDRFYRVVHRDEHEKLYLGERSDDPLRINLIEFHTKPKKTRDSIVLKLLHKPENVAEELFDRVGIRFITETPLDALLVVKYLKDKMIVVPPNIKPSRSRNTLVDMDHFKHSLKELIANFEQGKMTEADLLDAIQNSTQAPGSSSSNPHTSEHYRAVQFTCRQLIKLKNPLYDHIKEIRARAKKMAHPDDELSGILDRIDLKYVQREVRFFYPYEIQVLDQKSFEENERGKSAHGEYKKSQVHTAMKRVMSGLFPTPSGKS